MKRQSTYIILGILAALIVLLSMAVFQLNQPAQPSTDHITDTQDSNTSLSKTSMISNNPDAPNLSYTLDLTKDEVPLNFKLANTGNKSVTLNDEPINCGSGSTVRFDRKLVILSEKGSMMVITPQQQESYDQALLQNVETIINQGVMDNETHTQARSTLFNISCSGFYSHPIQEITGIPYPGMDKFRMFLSGEGQGVFPNLNVVVFAEKDGNYITLSGTLREGPEALAYSQSYDKSTCQQQAIEECVKAYMLSPENLELANTRLNELVNEFQIAQ